MRPLVLLSNDDGHASAGIRSVRNDLSKAADVVLVAPENEQSASSHSLSLHRPLRLRTVDPDAFALDGTPADCVYVALYAGTRILPRRPDLIVSGNIGCIQHLKAAAGIPVKHWIEWLDEALSA